MTEESRPQEEVPAKHPTSPAPSEGILYFVGMKYLPATAKPPRIRHFRLKGDNPFLLAGEKKVLLWDLLHVLSSFSSGLSPRLRS